MYFTDKDLGVEFSSYLSGEFIFLEKEYDKIVLESLVTSLIDYKDLIHYLPNDSMSLSSVFKEFNEIITDKDIECSSDYIEVKIKGVPEVKIFFRRFKNNIYHSFSNLQLSNEDMKLILNLNTKEV